MLQGALAKNGSFGFAEGVVHWRAKLNELESVLAIRQNSTASRLFKIVKLINFKKPS